MAIGDRVQLLYPVVLQQAIVNKKYQMIRPNNLGAMDKRENKKNYKETSSLSGQFLSLGFVLIIEARKGS